MSEIICPGCAQPVDITGIEPFTICECSDCGAEFIIPRERDFLQLETPLGDKSAFSIFEGFDQQTNTPSKLFIVDDDHPNFESLAEVAASEAEKLKRLKSSYISPLLNSGPLDDGFFVAEASIDGLPLSDYSPSKHDKLDVLRLVDIMHETLKGVFTAHEMGVTHHDLTPEHIIIDNRKNVKITDFFISGLIYRLNVEMNEPLDSINSYFSSPEKLFKGRENEKGDVFSLGVTFYFLFTGLFPFQLRLGGESFFPEERLDDVSELLGDDWRVTSPDEIDYEPRGKPHNIRPEVPMEISLAIMKALSPNPEDRPSLPHLLTTIKNHKSTKERIKAELAKETMITTKTRAIPVMKGIGPDHKRKKRRRRLF